MKRTEDGSAMMLTEKVAGRIARVILTAQRRVSEWLNRKVNTWSNRGKKTALIITGVVTSILLISGTFTSYYRMPRLSQNYTSAHIGMASGLPQPKVQQRQLTDSLTIKK